MKKSCGNCVNCEKYGNSWACENVAGSEGWPCDCTPPHDEACKNWSDNPADKDDTSAYEEFLKFRAGWHQNLKNAY